MGRSHTMLYIYTKPNRSIHLIFNCILLTKPQKKCSLTCINAQQRVCVQYAMQTHAEPWVTAHMSVYWMHSVQWQRGEKCLSLHFVLCDDFYKLAIAVLLISSPSSAQMRRAWSVSSTRVTAGPTAHVAPTQSGHAIPACPAWPTASCVLIATSVPSVRMATGSSGASARLPSAEWVSLSCHSESYSSTLSQITFSTDEFWPRHWEMVMLCCRTVVYDKITSKRPAYKLTYTLRSFCYNQNRRNRKDISNWKVI